MTFGYTEVSYNDVVITDCQTLNFEQTKVLDPTDGQTPLYDRFRVTVQGYFVSGPSSIQVDAPGYPTSTNAAERYTQLRNALMEKRRPFLMTCGKGSEPVVVLQAIPVDTADQALTPITDRNDGPTPSDVTVTHITGSQTFRIVATWDIHLRPPCLSRNIDETDDFGVLSNRWACIDSIGDQRQTVRTYQGQLTLSQPLRNPHEFRGLVLPPLPLGMMRKQMEFAAQPDNLKLRYTIRDEEVTQTPLGLGSHETDGTYLHVSQSEQVEKHATQAVTTLDVLLKGTVRTSRKVLAKMAIAYADAKLLLSNFIRPLNGVPNEQDNAVIVLGYRLFEEFDSGSLNQVRLQIAVQRLPFGGNGATSRLINQVFATFGNRVEGHHLAAVTSDAQFAQFLSVYNSLASWGNRVDINGNWEYPHMEGTASMTGAIAAYLQASCTRTFDMYLGNQIDTARTAAVANSVGVSPPAAVSYAEVFELPDMSNSYMSAESQQSVYEHYSIESVYTTTENVVPLAIAGPADDYYYPGGTSGPPPQATLSPGVARDTTAFARLTPPQTLRTLRVEASRNGETPRLPKPFTSFQDEDGIRHVLIARTSNNQAPQLSGNLGNRQFVVQAELHYALSRPPKQYRTGIPDHDSATSGGVSQFIIPTSELYSSDRGTDYSSE